MFAQQDGATILDHFRLQHGSAVTIDDAINLSLIISGMV